jgi:phosphoribosylglycinamide formyltransferase 1
MKPASAKPDPRIAVLLSGRGSNLIALHEAMLEGRCPGQIALVLSNEPAAPGLERARGRGLAARAIPHRGAGGREAHDRLLLAALAEAEVDWVCLAGYMRLLSPLFVRSYPQRILNIHPSLLPAFPGLDAQRQALDHGARVTGCTVHLVDEGLDTGPIVEQRAVPVLDHDDEVSLGARILEQEHQAYPAALRRLLEEDWAVVGKRIVFRGLASSTEKSGKNL